MKRKKRETGRLRRKCFHDITDLRQPASTQAANLQGVLEIQILCPEVAPMDTTALGTTSEMRPQSPLRQALDFNPIEHL